MPTGYYPDEYPSIQLEGTGHTYFQEIGIVRWTKELGSMDFVAEVSMSSTHFAMQTQRNHLQWTHNIQ
jgi:hypothetical protein